MKCQLCGYQFDKKQAAKTCNNCPIGINCPLIRCPNCNYEWPMNEKNNNLVPLIKLKKEMKGVVDSICTSQINLLKKIIAMGIMPGMKITMIRRFPTLFCQIGYSQFALDKEIAKYILVSIK